MEQKKTDINSIIGFIFLGAIALWWVYSTQPTPEELEKQKTERIQDSINKVQQQKKSIRTNQAAPIQVVSDSIAQLAAKNELGLFANSSFVNSNETTVIENNLLKLTILNKGGQIKEALLKNFNTYDSLPVRIIKDNNASFNINFGTTDNRILNTKDLNFTPTLSQNGENQVLSMKLMAGSGKFLEYRYISSC